MSQGITGKPNVYKMTPEDWGLYFCECWHPNCEHERAWRRARRKTRKGRG